MGNKKFEGNFGSPASRMIEQMGKDSSEAEKPSEQPKTERKSRKEDDEKFKVRFTVLITEEQRKRLEFLSVFKKTPVNNLIREGIDHVLDENDDCFEQYEIWERFTNGR